MFNFFKRKPVAPIKPPTKTQIEVCERLGLNVKPDMSSHDVWQLVEDAKQKPEIKKLYDAYVAEQNAFLEAEDRDVYGDAIVDELKKWEKVCDGNQYITVFKKGRTLSSDILEFEFANIEGEQKHYVKIEGLRPKIYKPRDESPYIEWEREISFRSEQILELIKLPKKIDMFDIDEYERTLLKAKEVEAKYQ